MGAGASSALALDKRFALCVGVNGVAGREPLGGVPLRDAEDVAAALQRAGWTATAVLDPSDAELRAAVEAFAAKLTPDGQAFFFFAGHGARDADGRNVLLSREEVLNDRALRSRGMRLDEILAAIAAKGAQLNVCLVDAARDPELPLERSVGGAALRGLVAPQPPRNCVVGFAAAPGALAPATPASAHNGAFARAFLARVLTPGRDVSQLLDDVARAVALDTGGRQQPWHASALQRRDLCIVPAAAADMAPSAEDAALADLRADTRAKLAAAEAARDYAAALELLRASSADAQLVVAATLTCGRISAAGAPPRAARDVAAAVDALVATLTEHCAVADVAVNGCWAIMSLSFSDASARAAAGGAGGVEAASRCLATHGKDARVCAAAARCLAKLLVNSAENSARGGEAGALEGLAAALRAHGAADDAVAKRCCDALASACHGATNRGRALAAGAPAAAAACLKPDAACMRRAAAVASVCKALRVMAALPGDSRAAVAAAGGVAAAAAAMRAHPADADVAEQALWLLACLVPGDAAAAASAANAGVLDAAVAALRTHADVHAVTALAARVLGHLAGGADLEALKAAQPKGFLASAAHALRLDGDARAAEAEAEAAAQRRAAARDAGAPAALAAALDKMGGNRFVAASATAALQQIEAA